MKEFLHRDIEPYEAASVAAFIKTFNGPLDPKTWAGLIEEEANEVAKAFAEEGPEQKLKELADLRYVIVGFALVSSDYYRHIYDEDAEFLSCIERAGEIVDAVIAEHGDTIPDHTLDTAFDRVHASNMSKLDDDGNPVIRESDGKVLKGPNYKAPDLSDLAQYVEVAA